MPKSRNPLARDDQERQRVNLPWAVHGLLSMTRGEIERCGIAPRSEVEKWSPSYGPPYIETDEGLELYPTQSTIDWVLQNVAVHPGELL